MSFLDDMYLTLKETLNQSRWDIQQAEDEKAFEALSGERGFSITPKRTKIEPELQDDGWSDDPLELL